MRGSSLLADGQGAVRQCLTQEGIVLIVLTHVNYFINFTLKFSPFLWGMLIMC